MSASLQLIYLMKIFFVILDGWGWSPIREGNLLLDTPTPHLDTLLEHGKFTLLRTASLEIGLPWGSVGDSEIGHYNLGTGRIVVVHRSSPSDTHLIAVSERSSSIDHASEAGIAIRDPKQLSTPISLTSCLADYGLRVAKIATAHKLPALTAAMNGYPASPPTNETAYLIKSDEDLIRTLETESAILAHDLIVINLPGADVAAHTGNLLQLRQSISSIDTLLGELAALVSEQQGVLYLAADHGNIEQMLTINGQIETTHSTSPVIFARVSLEKRTITAWQRHDRRKLDIATHQPTGLLADVAPTILEDFGAPIPKPMLGISLLRQLR